MDSVEREDRCGEVQIQGGGMMTENWRKMEASGKTLHLRNFQGDMHSP